MKIYLILTLIITLVLSVAPFSVLIFDSDAESTSGVVFEQNSDDETIKVMSVSSGTVVDLSLSDYVKGAVASEMPASYEEEALKAQAVVCYTYALWLKGNSDSGKLMGADISDSPQTHQGYCNETQLKEKWGDMFDINMQKISNCVDSVFGEKLQYKGKPIMAVYHALSPGHTEDAVTVWGNDTPYLKSVIANGDKLANEFESTTEFTPKKFKDIAMTLKKMSLSDEAKDWVGNCETDEVGYVKSVRIGSEYYNGNEVRSAFSLNSPFFTLKYSGGKFIFNVFGKGHGLGMSQNSADYMARQGSSYKEILLHFYIGAELVK